MAEIGPLRRRMIEDMTGRNLSPATQQSTSGGHVEQCDCVATRIAYNSCLMGRSSNGELAVTCWRCRAGRRQSGSPLQGALEECDQFIGRLECAAPQMWRDNRLHRIELLRRVATRVDFSGGQRGMAQPQRHLPNVLGRLQDDNRAGVSEHVGRDAFPAEARVLPSGSRGMLLEQIGEAPSAQRLSTCIDEHLGCCDLPANGEPGAQCCGRRLPQRERPFPPSLAENTNAHRWQVDILDLHPSARIRAALHKRPRATSPGRGCHRVSPDRVRRAELATPPPTDREPGAYPFS